ncbi:MAG: glycoside hydrolase family 43 protein, partial [Pseudonocardiaceae bacterium]
MLHRETRRRIRSRKLVIERALPSGSGVGAWRSAPHAGWAPVVGLPFAAMSLSVGRGWRNLLATVPAVAAMVATTIGAGLPARIEPSISRDFPDPTVLSVGGTYYAYSTASRYGGKTFHVPVRRSTRLTGDWGPARDALPELPAWVDTTAPGEGSVWAPALTDRDDGYLLYFTARSASQRAQCIGVARAWAPQGPFHPIGSHPLVCQPGDSDDIDPTPFTDTDGRRYLLYSASRGGNATIWLQRLTPEGTDTISDRRAVIVSDRADEDHVVEAPAILRHGGKYVLFYSANLYHSGHYFINYAIADTLGDEFVKHDGQFLNQHTIDDVYQNPGGQDVLHASGHDFLVFHADTTPTSRGMFVVGLSWDRHDQPVTVLLGDRH